MYDVTLISDIKQDGIRKASFQTCAEVCSEQIDIETEGDIIRRVKYTKGCHGEPSAGGRGPGTRSRMDGLLSLRGADGSHH